MSKAPRMKYGSELFNSKNNKVHRRNVFGDNERVVNFSKAISNVLFLHQFFGLLPVSGILSSNVYSLKFKILSIRTIFSLLVFGFFTFEFGLTINFLVRSTLRFEMVGKILYNSLIIFGVTYSFYLAVYWKDIMIDWFRMEKVFLGPPYSNRMNRKKYLTIKINLFCMLLVFMTFADYYFHFYSAYIINSHLMKDCGPKDFWKVFYVNKRPFFLSVVPYSSYLIPILEISDMIKNMCWIFPEMLLISMSLGLVTRFDQLTNRLETYNGTVLSQIFWHEIYSHYVLLCDLVSKADQILSPIILIYSFSNLFFICEKIFRIFDSNIKVSDHYYYIYSSIFVIARTMTMLYLGGGVNDASKKMLSILRNAPTQNWCDDYYRLLVTIQSNNPKLSGANFFFLTKGLVLTIAGNILTYEIVLIQQTDEIKKSENGTTVSCGDILLKN